MQQPDYQINPDRDLRGELATAIQVQRAADATLGRASGIASTAENLLREAGAEVSRLQAAQREAERLVTCCRAEAIALAIRSGAELPARADPAPADLAPISAALASYHALEIAAGKLGAERDAARAEADAAAQTVQRLVDAIVTGEAHQLATELIASAEHHWRLFDRLAGLIRLDEARPSGPTLRPLQENVIQRIDRHKAAIARNPLYLERHNFNQYVDDLAAAEERRWLDYSRRLVTNAQSRFEE